MRTGIIHLTGLAAMLLFALTIIVWIDGYWHSTTVLAATDTATCVAWTHLGEFGVVWHPSPTYGMLNDFDVMRNPVSDVVKSSDMFMGTTLDGFGFSWNHPVNEDMFANVWAIRLPCWFVALGFAIVGFFYLRFLRNRKRHRVIDDDKELAEPAG